MSRERGGVTPVTKARPAACTRPGAARPPTAAVAPRPAPARTPPAASLNRKPEETQTGAEQAAFQNLLETRTAIAPPAALPPRGRGPIMPGSPPVARGARQRAAAWHRPGAASRSHAERGMKTEGSRACRPAHTLTMSLPDSEDTEDADEPEDSSWGLGRDRGRRGPQGGSGSRRGGCSPSHALPRSLTFTLLSVDETRSGVRHLLGAQTCEDPGTATGVTEPRNIAKTDTLNV